MLFSLQCIRNSSSVQNRPAPCPTRTKKICTALRRINSLCATLELRQSIEVRVASSNGRSATAISGSSSGRSSFLPLLLDSVAVLVQRFSRVVSHLFFEKQQQIPFGFAQGRLSTHHPQAEKRLGPRSLRMTTLVLLRTLGTGHSPIGASSCANV